MNNELMERLRDVGIMLKVASMHLHNSLHLTTSSEHNTICDIDNALDDARNAISKAGVELKMQERGE